MERHLDLLEMDAVRAGDAGAEERAHALACGSCRDAVERMRLLAGRLGLPKLDVPPDVDRAVLAMRRPRPRIIWTPFAAAAAVLLALGIASYLIPRDRTAPETGTAEVAPADIDRNGVVDIVDAYVLALKIRDAEPLDPSWNVDGIGGVDEKDVEMIARQSVSLSGRRK